MPLEARLLCPTRSFSSNLSIPIHNTDTRNKARPSSRITVRELLNERAKIIAVVALRLYFGYNYPGVQHSKVQPLVNIFFLSLAFFFLFFIWSLVREGSFAEWKTTVLLEQIRTAREPIYGADMHRWLWAIDEKNANSSATFFNCLLVFCFILLRDDSVAD